jgi:hypothetical protein
MTSTITRIVTAVAGTLHNNIRKVIIVAFLIMSVGMPMLAPSVADAHNYNNCRRSNYYYTYHGHRYWDKYYKRTMHQHHYDNYYHVYERKYNSHTHHYYWAYSHDDKRHC